MSKLSIKWQKIIVWFVAYLGILCFGLSPVAVGALVILAFLGASIYLIKKSYNEEVLNSVKVALLFVIAFFVLLGLFYIIREAGADMRIAILVVNIIAFVAFIVFCILDVLGLKFVAKIPAIFGLSEKEKKENEPIEEVNVVEPEQKENQPVIENKEEIKEEEKVEVKGKKTSKKK